MIIVMLALLGLIFGSFVNALVWRLHEQEEMAAKPKKAGKKRQRDLSIMRGRSMCPNCGHELAAKDLVPVLSWLSLGGKCRYCGRPISWQYPLVELMTALLFVYSYVHWPLGFSGSGLLQFIVWLFFVVMFMALGVYDLRWFLLPNRMVYPLLGVAVIEALAVAVLDHDLVGIWQPFAAAAIISGLFYALYQLSGGNWIGGGDVKLAVVLGLLAATPGRALLLIFLASLIGTVVTLPLALQNRRKLQMQIPFGPFLLLATSVVVLFGSTITNWYVQRFL